MRGAALVLDTLTIEPSRPPTPPDTDTWDETLPPDERLGPELIVNGGFEAFQPTDRFSAQHQVIHGWCFNSPIPATEPIVRQADRAHAGSQALRLNPDPLEDSAIVYQPNVPAVSGRQYRVSFWARGSGFLYAQVYQPQGARQEDSQRATNYFPVAETWRRYSYVLVPSASGKVTALAFVLAALYGSDIWFDDVSIREIVGP